MANPLAPTNPMPSNPPPDVMGAMKAEAGHGGRKKPSEIVRDYVLAVSGSQKAADNIMTIIAQQMQQKIGRLVQFGNTVFWAQQKGPGVLDVHVFTQESPKVLAKRMTQAYQWAKERGFKMITSTLTDEEMPRLIKASGLPAKLTQTTISNGKQMVPAYQMQMEVK